MDFISGFLIGGSLFFVVGAWAEWLTTKRRDKQAKQAVDLYYDRDLSYLLRRQGE